MENEEIQKWKKCKLKRREERQLKDMQEHQVFRTKEQNVEGNENLSL